jgi:hypothetical protein
MSIFESKDKIMKIVYRTLIILLAASIVSAGLYLAVDKSSSTFTTGGLPERPQFENRGTLQSDDRLQAPTGDLRPEGRDDGGSIEGIFGLLGSLLKIAIITAFVLLVKWVGRKIFRHPATRQA